MSVEENIPMPEGEVDVNSELVFAGVVLKNFNGPDPTIKEAREAFLPNRDEVRAAVSISIGANAKPQDEGNQEEKSA